MNTDVIAGVRKAVRRGALVVMVGAVLAGGIACGGSSSSPSPAATTTSTTDTGTGASESVTITETETMSETPAPSESGTATPLPKPVAQDIERDPFVNPMVGGGMSTTTRTRPRPTVSPRTTGGGTTGGGTTGGTTGGGTTGGRTTGGGQVAADEEEENVPPPDVTVTGIVMGAGKYRAIVNGPEQSYIVGVGDKLAEYRVTAITPTAVTFSYKGKSFKVKLEDEFGGQR